MSTVNINKRKKTDPERKKRNKKILDLRIAGLSERAIAEEIGNISDTTVHKVINEALEQLNAKIMYRAGVIKRMELERLDRLYSALFANRNDPRVADTLLRIMERRARYLGIDAPVRTEQTNRQDGPVVVVKHDLTKLSIEELRALEQLTRKLESADADDGAAE